MGKHLLRLRRVSSSPGCQVDIKEPDKFPENIKVKGASAYLRSSLPIFAARYQRPSSAVITKECYFEIRPRPDGWSNKSDISFGIAVPSYQGIPGHLPGSIAIRCGDGRIYLNNSPVGNSCTCPISSGDEVGIGVRFTHNASTSTAAPPLAIEIFRTRDGEVVEMIDVKTLSSAGMDVSGFDGNHDLFAVVGTIDEVEFEVVFGQTWQRYRREVPSLTGF